jgi:aarF domain-containing kinase
MSKQMKEMRETMAKDEKVKSYMDALRGAGMQDYDAAEMDMRLLDEAEGVDSLPQQYDPVFLKNYYSQRPQLVTQRSFQLAAAFSGYVGRVALDALTGKMKENEVARTILLRESVTSLVSSFATSQLAGDSQRPQI